VGMKGFIEVHVNRHLILINVNRIISVFETGYEDMLTIYTDEIDTDGESRAYLCDESYDEIKRMIEEAMK
jgi:hypothetical protein